MPATYLTLSSNLRRSARRAPKTSPERSDAPTQVRAPVLSLGRLWDPNLFDRLQEPLSRYRDR